MSDELARVVDRAQQNRQARAQERDTARQSAPPSATVIGASFVLGDRVFDRVSGQEGTVVAVTRENVVVPSAER